MNDDTRPPGRPLPVRAYRNPEFLGSPEARKIRVLCEFTEPELRLRQNGVVSGIPFMGSARALPADRATTEAERELARYYEDARTLARLVTSWTLAPDGVAQGLFVITGGGPGIMEAGNRGAAEAGGRSIGLGIDLGNVEEANPYVTPELNFEFHYFFVRKYWFVYLAQALVVFPGGFGTCDELFETLTLVQTHKTQRHAMPIVLYGRDYWEKVVDFDEMARLGTISRSDLEHFCWADSPEEAFAHVTRDLGHLAGDRLEVDPDAGPETG